MGNTLEHALIVSGRCQPSLALSLGIMNLCNSCRQLMHLRNIEMTWIVVAKTPHVQNMQEASKKLKAAQVGLNHPLKWGHHWHTVLNLAGISGVFISESRSSDLQKAGKDDCVKVNPCDASFTKSYKWLLLILMDPPLALLQLILLTLLKSPIHAEG